MRNIVLPPIHLCRCVKHFRTKYDEDTDIREVWSNYSPALLSAALPQSCCHRCSIVVVSPCNQLRNIPKACRIYEAVLHPRYPRRSVSVIDPPRLWETIWYFFSVFLCRCTAVCTRQLMRFVFFVWLLLYVAKCRWTVPCMIYAGWAQSYMNTKAGPEW